MTTTMLSTLEQVSLQQALICNKHQISDTVNIKIPPTSRQLAYSDIAVMLYHFSLPEIAWPSFLKTVIARATDECQWLTKELIKCQQAYTAKPRDALSIEQGAFLCGIFSEELAYIEHLLATEQ